MGFKFTNGFASEYPLVLFVAYIVSEILNPSLSVYSDINTVSDPRVPHRMTVDGQKCITDMSTRL